MKAKFTLPYILGGLMGLVATSSISDSMAAPTPNISRHSIVKPDTMFQVVDSLHVDTVALPFFMPRPFKSIDRKQDILYICENGDTICRSRGSRAWRNNNPGNIVYGKFALDNGAIGKGGQFAVFPNEETGRTALTELLKGDGYRNLTIARAISKYAPPHQNNVTLYRQKLKRMTGLNLDMKLSQLTPEQMEKVVDAICVIEGWTPGKEKVMAATKPAAANSEVAMAKILRDSLRQKTI